MQRRHTTDNRLLIYLFVAALLVPVGGSWGNHPPSVSAQEVAPHAAVFIAQQVPATMARGESYTVSLTVRNTGAITWTGDAGFKLGSQHPRDNGIWGIGRVLLAPDETVAPGQTTTFTFDVKAPGDTGTYPFQWQMLREGVAWFGELSPPVTVDVVESLPPMPVLAPVDMVPIVPYVEVEADVQQLSGELLRNQRLREGVEALRAIEQTAPAPHNGNLALALADPEYIVPYAPREDTLVPIRDTSLPTQKSWIQLSSFIVEDLHQLIEAARTETGYQLEVRSAYRSASTQNWLLQDMARQYGEYALLSSARAGHSEHQLGTTVDLLPRGHSFATFPPDLAQWMTVNAPRFGFVVSYPSGVPAEQFQYRPEPWHVRWVGSALAADVQASGLALDIYLRDNVYHLPPYQAPPAMQQIARSFGYVE